jgi:hypothetical protein
MMPWVRGRTIDKGQQGAMMMKVTSFSRPHVSRPPLILAIWRTLRRTRTSQPAERTLLDTWWYI